MDRDMSVSLWCEEVEDEQSQVQSQTEAPAQGCTMGSSQLRAAWDPTVSGHRVIQRLLHVEERYMPSMLYITLIQRDPERREELAKWALEVQNSHAPVSPHGDGCHHDSCNDASLLFLLSRCAVSVAVMRQCSPCLSL